jgi:major type 1 subunit fimbrin (pilin)
MNKNILSIAVALTLSTVSVSANAGTITFSGQINATSCTLVGGGNLLAVPLPAVAVDSVAAVGAHNGSHTFRVEIVCPGADDSNTLSLALMPEINKVSGSYVLMNQATVDAAENVGVVVINAETGSLVDFTNGGRLEHLLDADGGTVFNLSATYARIGSVTPTAGAVMALLPFSISYR